MINLSNCESTTNWLAEGLTEEEIAEVKRNALEEAARELEQKGEAVQPNC